MASVIDAGTKALTVLESAAASATAEVESFIVRRLCVSVLKAMQGDVIKMKTCPTRLNGDWSHGES